MTIKQRIAISSLLSKTDFADCNLDQIKRILGSTNLFKLRAELDVLLILGHIAEQANQTILKGMVGQQEGHITLGVHLIELFETELP